MDQLITARQTRLLIKHIGNSPFHPQYDYKKHKVSVYDDLNNELLYIRLPLTIHWPHDGKNRENEVVHFIILLIQSGSSATGYFENERILDHKVFKSYMVRKKQGKSQIKHLKTKGKSRAGSRIRLANTIRFFENINERLNSYFNKYTIDRIALSCPVTLSSYLFNSRVPPPFDKKDERVYKIPKHVHTPGQEVLMNIHGFLLKGEIIIRNSEHPGAKDILGIL